MPLEEDASTLHGIFVYRIAHDEWPNLDVFNEIYDSIDPKTPKSRLTYVMTHLKFFRMKEAILGLKEMTQAKDPWSTDRFNCMIECTRAEDYIKLGFVPTILDLMKVHKCSPNYKTLASLIYSGRHCKDVNKAARTALDSLAEFKAMNIPLPLYVYERLAEMLTFNKPFPDTMIQEIVKDVSGKDWTSVVDINDGTFFVLVMGLAFKNRKLDMAYQLHNECLLYGQNESLLFHYRHRYKYYNDFLNLIFSVSRLDLKKEKITF